MSIQDYMMIVSGGQTGADRAALDWAIDHNVLHGGWCPKGRKAEDGLIPDRYVLRETPNDDSAQRTEWNVRDSDGTVIFSMQPSLSGGSKHTADLAHKHGKPMVHLFQSDTVSSLEQVLIQFISENQIRTLNVAGPRASEEPGIDQFVRDVFDHAFVNRN